MRIKEMEWKENTEKIFKKWCDHATCYSWMHDRSYKKYNCHYTWFTVPVIILSTITGTANFAHERYEEYAGAITMVIGAMNILAGIITTVAQFCKIGSKVESHRIAAIFWDKFGRNIRVELAKDRDERLGAGDFMKTSKEEYNRLIEISPDIPRDVISAFRNLAISSNVMEIDPLEDADMGDCICCDECCFGVSIIPRCCKSKKRRSCDIEQPNDSRPTEQIELPEICGNFKPTEISKEKKIETIFGKGQYGMFNIEEIVIDDDNSTTVE
ncbi:hypothetical protein CPAV1605_1374 [seawater metagenome]|uniref:SMODS and SLOG-associating 2TM effector domain-containing protein n=1 Tax=seawater metagenome TaxID=1561972 RepID=A0A5E8CMA7_9ZZZZ